MKNLLGYLFLSSICFVPRIHSASTGDNWFAYQNVKQDASAQVAEQTNKNQDDMEPSVVGDLPSVLTRALSSDPVGSSKDAKGVSVLAKNQVRFTKSAYAPGASSDTNVLYLGAENLGIDTTVMPHVSKVLGTDKANFALSRAFLGYNSSGAFAPMVQSLAPSKVTINGEQDQDNPLVQKSTNVTHLILQNKALPVLTIQADDGSGGTKPATEIIAVVDAASGTSLLQNKNPIKDANGDPIDKSIVAIGASTQEIFAAVPAMGQDFDAASPAGDNRGIAVLRRAVDDLTIINNDKATKLDVAAYDLNDPAKKPLVRFAFFNGADAADFANHIDNAKLGNTAAMFWDDTFQRLFIGVSAKRNDINKAGGVLNLAVGRLEKVPDTAATADVLMISPIVENPTKELFYNDTDKKTINTIDKVVGFYFDNVVPAVAGTIDTAMDATLATDIIRSMHTSTGKDYLIIAGRFSVNGADFTKEIYAIPLLGNAVNADPKNPKPQLVGTLAKKDFSGPPVVLADMPQKDDVRVGGASGSFDSDVNIADLFVSGDSVYLCLAGRNSINPDESREVGIFQSTALFDSTGIINSWTPFTRVMGSMERIFGAGLDNKTGEYLFVTETNEAKPALPFFNPAQPNIFADNISSVRLSGWGKTDSANNLGVVLENVFPQSQGGVHQLIAFDEKTPGFHLAGILSVMLTVGSDRVALIQSGKFDPVSFIFYPETVFTTSGLKQNVFVRNDDALKDIGPISSADFARSRDNDEGWLFVGGYDGVAVLSKMDGKGFDSNAGLMSLTTAGFPGPTYSFKKLTPNANSKFDHVRKLQCLNRVLYVLTNDKVYSVGLAAGKFKDAPGVADLDEQVVFDTEKFPGTTLLDFIILDGHARMNDFKALLATTKGLFMVTHDGTKYVTQEVKVGGQSLGPVIQMQYLSSTKGTPSAFGNLYVLAADITKNPAETKIYRFAVNTMGGFVVIPIPSNNVTPAGLVVDLGQFRSNFFADGSTILHSRGLHFGDTNYLAAVPTTDFKLSTPLTSKLALTTINTNIGAVVRESASGALYAPGDWGVRANL